MPISLRIRAWTQLTVHFSTRSAILLDPCIGPCYDVFDGGGSANAYLGTVGEEGTSWDNVINHLDAFSCKVASEESRSGRRLKVQIQLGRRDASFYPRVKVPAGSHVG